MSEEKKVKILSVTGNGSFKSQYGDENGLLYSFIYTLENENGQSGEFRVNHKTTDPKFKIGETVVFEDKGQDNKGNKKASLSKEGSGGGYSGGSKKNSDTNLKGIKIGHAITNAVSLYCAYGADLADNPESPKDSIRQYAKMIYQISEELNTEI